MRIRTLEVENFKKFRKQTIELDLQFTLLVGENGSGKTSLLDALSIAAAIWLVDVPDCTIKITNSTPTTTIPTITPTHRKKILRSSSLSGVVMPTMWWNKRITSSKTLIQSVHLVIGKSGHLKIKKIRQGFWNLTFPRLSE